MDLTIGVLQNIKPVKLEAFQIISDLILITCKYCLFRNSHFLKLRYIYNPICFLLLAAPLYGHVQHRSSFLPGYYENQLCHNDDNLHFPVAISRTKYNSNFVVRDSISGHILLKDFLK